MNTKKILTVCACLLVLSVTVMGTLAWLTDTATAVNTFTVGDVEIIVDETDVNPDGTETGGSRVTENEYHLIPGQTYIKDPTMTVKAGSEESYVRMLVTLNCKSELDEIFAPDGVKLDRIFNGWDSTIWNYYTETEDAEANTVTYEFRYWDTVDPGEKDVVLDALFDSFTVPGELDGDDLKSIEKLTITVVGHAIQAVGFDNAAEAWAAFDAQMNP